MDVLRDASTRPTEFSSMPDLIQRANLPVDQLEDLFRDHAHMTAAQWLRRVQARRAAKAINTARSPEIAGADAGFLSSYMVSAADQNAGGHLDIEGPLDGSAVAAQDALVSQKGIGIWTARYVMMRTGFAAAAPVGASGLAAALQRLYPSAARPGAEEAGRLMFKFSPHRSLASMHLWASLSDEE